MTNQKKSKSKWRPPKYFKIVLLGSLLALAVSLLWPTVVKQSAPDEPAKEIRFEPDEFTVFGYAVPPEPTFMDRAIALLEAAGPWAPVLAPIIYFYFGKRED